MYYDMTKTPRSSRRGIIHAEQIHPTLVEFNRDPTKPAPRFDYCDLQNVKNKIKHLHVGGNATIANIPGRLMLELLKKMKNYRADIIDNFDNHATMVVDGNVIYVVTNSNFVHSNTYTARPVTNANARRSDKWFKVYFSGIFEDNKVIFPKVRFTRIHFWERTKKPKVI